MILAVWACVLSALGGDRLRVMVETDAGGDPDDEQSMVRFLLYASEWDIEGIIATRPVAREGENRNIERTGLGIVRRMIDAYAECHSMLVQHDPRFPTAEKLRAVTIASYGEGDDGARLIMAAADVKDARPIWFMNWGTDAGSAPSSLKRALDLALRERGREGYERLKSRIYLSSSDQFGDHTWKVDPPFPFWVDTFRPPIENRRWYHRFSTITARAGGFDLARDVLMEHGPLGALYPTNTTHWQKEGDSMTFLYLVPTGMNDPMRPGWGSWAGRYGLQDEAGRRRYYWANQFDGWNGSTNRDNTLARWAAHLQNDFRVRLDWCIKGREEANHKPLAVLNGDESGRILRLSAAAGSRLNFTAAGSADPDKDALRFEWMVYREAGTYKGPPLLSAGTGVRTELRVPEDAGGSEIHVLLIVEDDGQPPLADYCRAVVDVSR
jgi:hypothetical protein